MAHKRPRAAFEADLQAHQSPFVFYGTPLPPLDPDTRDDGSYVPVWKQTVTDERGRKRLHGAFTGGFSAGYFNTVGSKEGWTPSTFVSSRTNRHKDQAKPAEQRPEDYMDDEDLADAAEAEKLQTNAAFSGLGSTNDELSSRDIFTGLGKADGDTMGVKLLQRMGWRQGQGIGSKVRRKARLDETTGADAVTHLFAPDNSRIITFTRKSNHKGLGYQGEGRLESSESTPKPTRLLIEPTHHDPLAGPKSRKQKQKSAPKKSGFGVGILNDTGSDDEDPYEMGPKISYNRVIGSDKKSKKSEVVRPTAKSANPLVTGRPVFVSKFASKRVTSSTKRTCHDGRLPLTGFILATEQLSLQEAPAFAPPKIPPEWKSSRQQSTVEASQPAYQSVTDAAKASSLDPKARAALLGEAALPGKSVFDYLKPEARDRLASASGKTNLPQARGEAPPEGFRKDAATTQKDLWSLVPELPKDIAAATLAKGAGGWMPYADDEGKRARYVRFLELRARTSGRMPERKPGTTVSDWAKELQEFVHAAKVFKPITGLMASRFTSSSSTIQPSSSSNGGGDKLLHTPAPKPQDPAEEAAKLGMYGPMTRTVQQFFPTRLLCKRFNVKPPAHVQPDPSTAHGDQGASSSASRTQEPVSKASIDEIMKDAALHNPNLGLLPGDGAEISRTTPFKEAVMDVERNEALEGEKAGDAVFKAIFGSDDEDDED
ncbi:DUF1604-domain-containing protein [Mytilinidion resinicola]|uniref:DUF1604-domain-containing protein n=1 Tax=Mytilinidion resinicola TaxID=574789 RepID=A0A6A6Y8N8_9PEZI|nr:DUF1604-domain-containing protein [Mytilinidion resinicola]KAF2804979.1 DUF1604-domain-containing protein [Mytilinidion resinicola]